MERSYGPFYGFITMLTLAGYAALTGPLSWYRLLIMASGGFAYFLFRFIQDMRNATEEAAK
jgi:hypothetical protein